MPTAVTLRHKTGLLYVHVLGSGPDSSKSNAELPG
jgi:hypothetical protein